MPRAVKYKVLHELGAGGMGTIHKGVLEGHAGFQRPIVIKRLKQEDDANHVRLFVDEARRYAVLDHENIGRIFDFEVVDKKLCIILEYIDGWSLTEVIAQLQALQRRPDVELAVFITSRVCRALQYVFESASIVHRDVSPSNVMITREGAVKLIDFGIATRSGTRERGLSGKPAYMAPEMVVELRADNRSDVFSLGAVLYETLTLDRLFKGQTMAQVLEQVVAGQQPSPRKLNPAIPDPVLAILSRALQRDSSKRYPSAAAMGSDCEHFLYDKGYGPTNLALKQYLRGLFPDEGAPMEPVEQLPSFPLIEPTSLPIDDGSSGTVTRVAMPRPPRPRPALPADSPEATAPPPATLVQPRSRTRRAR
jgi:serine/threonine-protein kinase